MPEKISPTGNDDECRDETDSSDRHQSSENYQGRVHHRYTIKGEYTYEEEKTVDKEKLEKMRRAIEESQKRLYSKAAIGLTVLLAASIVVIEYVDHAKIDNRLFGIILYGITACAMNLAIMHDLAQISKKNIRREFGYIQAVQSVWAYKFLKYDEVSRKLQKRGFQNIRLNPLGDLMYDSLVDRIINKFRIERVTLVQVDGSTFREGDWLPEDAEVVISYHSKQLYRR